MVHGKVRRVKEGVKSAKDKVQRIRFQRALKKARKKRRRQEKKENVKQAVRSKTAPARIEAKATKKELGELGAELGITRERGRQAKEAGSKVAKVAGSLFAVDQDRDGQVDRDELFFGVDSDQDGQVDDFASFEQVERELLGEPASRSEPSQSRGSTPATERELLGLDESGDDRFDDLEAHEREILGGEAPEEIERDILEG